MKPFAVPLRYLERSRVEATQGLGGIRVAPEFPSLCKGYPRAAEGAGLTWLLPAAIWFLNDCVQLPQIKAVPRPQTAGGYSGIGQGIKGVHLTDASNGLCCGNC